MAEIHCRPSQYQRPSCENTGALGGSTIRPLLGSLLRLISPSGTLAEMGVSQIKMPQLGESVTEGTVDKWLKREGDFVRRDEPLVEVVTDKVNAEIPSPFEGTLVRITVAEGTTVPIGAEIGQMEVEGALPEPPAAATPAPAEPSGAPEPVPARPSPEPAERQRFSPAVRRLAEEHGIDPSQIAGSGEGGRVTRDDVLAFVESRQAAGAAPAPGARETEPEGGA